jgi:hypothetical protein
MADWLSSMQQTFEYYTVDPGTWKDVQLLDNVKSCTISWDSEAETLGSATIDVTESLGECYIRVYLITIQNGVREKHPLGTFLVQTPSSSFNGKVRDVSMDAYTPLLELKESPPPLGYSILEDSNIMQRAYTLVREHARAPVARTECSEKLYYDFVADPSETWLSFLSALILNANYTFALDELGRILFAPKQDTASLQPVWTYDDGNCSILYPELTIDHDLYDIPNVIELVYSNGFYNEETGETERYLRVVNNDSNSPISTVNRGREIVRRITDPSIAGASSAATMTRTIVYNYAERLLKDLSSIEYTISYTHGYCPVRIGDGVRFNCPRAGLNGIKAKVISQSIRCEPGCPVSEKAVFITKLWR